MTSVNERLEDFSDEELPAVVARAKYRLRQLIRQELPTKQHYFGNMLSCVDNIKYIDDIGELSYSSDGITTYRLRLDNVFDLPVESLIDLRYLLAEHRKRSPSDWEESK